MSAVKLGVVLIVCGASLGSPANAADGPVIITQATALAGKVTPSDEPGFPVTISRGGSYRLGSNLQVSPSQHGIIVTASNVTLDMDGFALSGADTALTGIIVRNTANNFAVRNGTISDFRSRGISADHVVLTTVDEMRIYGNGSDGAYLGSYARVHRSDVSANGGVGINCLTYCHIQDNQVSANSKEGMIIMEGLAVGNTVLFNQLLGIKGYNIAGANNVFSGNNGSTAEQISGVAPMNPNVCIRYQEAVGC